MPRTALDRFEQRKLTRSKLVDAALKLFATSGYEHATVDDISAEAGYSKGAYYFHFSTKEDILLELLRMWTEARSATLAGAADARPSREGLHETLTAFFSYKDAPQWPGVLLEFWAQGVRNPEVTKRLTQAYAGWRTQLTDAFEAAGRDGVVRISSASDAASVALAAHDGFAVQSLIGASSSRAMTAAQLADAVLTPLEEAAAETERRAAAR